MEDDAGNDALCSAVARRSVPALEMAEALDVTACARDIADVVCTNKSSTMLAPVADAAAEPPFVSNELCVSSVVVDVGIVSRFNEYHF